MLQILMLLAVTAILCAIMITRSVMFEEIIVDIDIAGRLQGDNMAAGADPQSFAPEWANSVEEIAVSAQCNGDALGAECMIMILQGTAFPDGPHEIVIGASGGEDVDIIHAGVTATVLTNMGLRVKGGGEYQVFFQMVGEDGGEAICAAEIVWNSDAPAEPGQWISREAQNPAANANVQGANLQAVAATIAPGESTMIGGMIGASASDGGALGGHNACCIIRDGTRDQNEFNLGGFGGELITSEGDTMPPTQRHVRIPIKKSSHIFVEFRMTGEDSGTASSAASFKLLLP